LELGVVAATLSGWRDAFLDGGTAAMKSRPADDREDEIARPRSMVGQFRMDDELLGQKCQHLGSGPPFRVAADAAAPPPGPEAGRKPLGPKAHNGTIAADRPVRCRISRRERVGREGEVLQPDS
jgi:hypothetical protein